MLEGMSHVIDYRHTHTHAHRDTRIGALAPHHTRMPAHTNADMRACTPPAHTNADMRACTPRHTRTHIWACAHVRAHPYAHMHLRWPTRTRMHACAACAQASVAEVAIFRGRLRAATITRSRRAVTYIVMAYMLWPTWLWIITCLWPT